MQTLSPKQNSFLVKYADPSSSSFGNCYQSAIGAGYSDLTARNLTHNNPKWLSESLGQLHSIEPEQITQVLTSIIYNQNEPTLIKLRAIELMMRHHNMLKQYEPEKKQAIVMQIDLTGTGTPV